MFRKRTQGERCSFTFFAGVGERECEKSGNRIIELVGAVGALGAQELHTFLRLPKIAQRTRHLNDGAAAAYAAQTGSERATIERRSRIRMAGRVVRTPNLKERDRIFGRQFAHQRLY